MKYLTGQNEDGHWYAAIENGEHPSRLLDKKLCASREEAESLRDEAKAAEVLVFTAEMKAKVNPPRPAPEPEAEADPFDHDGDGKPGGSKPRGSKKAAK